MAAGIIQTADLHFRTYLHTVMPLHESLVEEMCAQSKPPLELATVLEDIGQRYMTLAERLNEALIYRGRLADEPDADEAEDSRVDEFLRILFANAGVLKFRDGTMVEGSVALRDSPIATNAVRVALMLAKATTVEATCTAP